MSSQIPYTPVTAEALERLTEDERASFTRAAQYVAEDSYPPIALVADLVLMVQRLITGDATAETKLAAIAEYCRTAIDHASSIAYMPSDARVSARQILAIIGGTCGDCGQPSAAHPELLSGEDDDRG